MAKLTRLGELERAVMDHLWSTREPQTVRQVHEALAARRDLAYTTIMTVLQRLPEEKKGGLQPGGWGTSLSPAQRPRRAGRRAHGGRARPGLGLRQPRVGARALRGAGGRRRGRR